MAAEASREFGVIGLGRIGGNLARQAVEKGMRVVASTRSGAPSDLLDMGLKDIGSPPKFSKHLSAPRVVFLYVPAGPVLDKLLDTLMDDLESGDIVVDGGNSYWGDSIRRSRRLEEKGLHFIDLGTSGGVAGARHGACFMAGGDDKAIQRVEPILKALAVPEGYVHAGPSGAGHFVKLVHNGIEFGMLQAIAEGIDLLAHYREPLDLPKVIHCWRHGSVIRSWLIDLMEEVYRDKGGLKEAPPFVEDTGEVNWLVDDALHMEVAVPVMSLSVMNLIASRDKQQHWARAIAIMRHGFGDHPFGPDESIAKERREGRVGGFYRDDD